jgi:hypothetical protein
MRHWQTRFIGPGGPLIVLASSALYYAYIPLINSPALQRVPYLDYKM